MTDAPLDQRERDELCDLFLALGPDAPTLCEGWATIDLAAHLYLREHRPTAAVGILVPRFAERTERVQAEVAERGLEALVADLRTPALFPWRVPKLRDLVNLNEYVVHHEDVRRANAMGPRTDRPDLQDAMWKVVTGSARLATRKLGPVGLELARPGGERRVARKGEPSATLTGEPVELALYLGGRKANAVVELTGAPEAVAAVETAPFGV
ncbi:MAG: uncharacterized protein JWN67_534 [Actinomycetia bacterium]|nr:uncharacterized protein [Actinomycetes bacterium]